MELRAAVNAKATVRNTLTRCGGDGGEWVDNIALRRVNRYYGH